MPRMLYTLIISLVALLLPLKLLWRSLKQPEYRLHWAERYGFYQQPVTGPLLWMHCVSVGETRAAQPLVQAWLKAYPDHQILMTHVTPTGRVTGAQLFATEIAAGRILQAYLPVDTPGMTARFLDYFNPRLGALMETELWFHLIDQASRRQIPMALLSARLSEKSARGYAKLGQLTRTSLQRLALVAAQTDADATRLKALGATHPIICGNLKFDVAPPADSTAKGQALRQLLGDKRTVFMAASTREGEEARLLDALDGLNLLTLLVPRHPQRFAEVEALLKTRGVRYVLRTDLVAPVADAVQVVLGNTMGEMYTYYAASDFALIGGSLQPLGGQNLIEAAVMGVPVIVGPHMFNFAQVTQTALAAGAAVQITDPAQLQTAIAQLSDTPQQRQHMAEAARQFTRQHQGTTTRLMTALHPFISR